ncbi:MAG: cytochrome c oxidase subunit 3 [Chloroflexi bacterium]|nr:cytochrome c oxidase subunit 3 [Chloroflexota bacterium]
MAHVQPIEEQTSTGLNNRKLLMWAFLGSDCMFFGALISTFLVYRGRSGSSILELQESHDAIKDAIGISTGGLSIILILLGIVAFAFTLIAVRRGVVKQIIPAVLVLFAIVVIFQSIWIAGHQPEFTARECTEMGGLVLPGGESCELVIAENLLDIPLTSLSTFVLLMSSLSMVMALSALERNNLPGFRTWLTATSILGVVFLGFQVFEFNAFLQEGLTPRENLFGSTFYVLTGFHGAHVTLGVLWLSSLVVASFKGKVTQKTVLDVEIAGLYWHFVDIVWIVIFSVIYLIGAYGIG